ICRSNCSCVSCALFFLCLGLFGQSTQSCDSNNRTLVEVAIDNCFALGAHHERLARVAIHIVHATATTLTASHAAANHCPLDQLCNIPSRQASQLFEFV